MTSPRRESPVEGSPEAILYKIREEKWLLSVISSHGLFCECNDYRRHIPGWPGDTGAASGGEGPSGGGGDAVPGVAPTDAELLDAVTFDMAFEDDDSTDAEQR
nr:MAG: ORF2 [Torque teno polar bear virus 23]WBM82683.1 MAG: ORF2 [Torque teno polar bear virus 26]WBM82717.1 MAG: ORF2 [Torque teno polar bear virus 38]